MKLIRLSRVLELTGLSRSTVYKFMAERCFPHQVELGGGRVAWVEGEVLDWIEEKIAARNHKLGQL